MITKLFLIALLLAGMASAQTPYASDEKAIRRLVADFMDAWNKHDAHAFAQTFAGDADFTNVRGVSAHGRKAIGTFMLRGLPPHSRTLT
jgi:uncharacterized protein (TIGR02246 family)